MDTKERRIEEIRRSILEYEKNLYTQTVALGEKLFKECDLSHIGSQGAVREAQGFSRELQGYREGIEEIRSSLQRLDAIQAKQREMDSEQDKIGKESEKLHLSIGTAFFASFKKGDIGQGKYKELFGPAMVKEERLLKIRQEIEEEDKGQKERGFLKLVMDSGKKSLLQGNAAMQQRLLQKELQRAGEMICDKGLVEEEKGVPLSAVSRQFLQNRERMDFLESQKTTLEEEYAGLSARLKELIGDRKAAVRIKELEAKIETTRRDLEKNLYAIGEKYLTAPEKVEASTLSGEVDSLNFLQESLSEKRKELERLLAMVEIERLDRKVEDLNLRIRTLEENIRRQQEEIKSHRKEVAKAVKERESLEAIAYPNEFSDDGNA